MAKLKKVSEVIELNLNYYIGKQDELKGIYNGKIEEPNYLDELAVDVFEDEIFDEESDDFVKTGKLQVSLSGSNRALEELGKFLIALSRYKTKDPSYHQHFDNINNSEGEEIINLIFRKM